MNMIGDLLFDLQCNVFCPLFKFTGEHAATIIAILALLFTIYQGYLTRRHNRLSVKPFLNFTNKYDANNIIQYCILKNSGLGPAIITNIKVYIPELKKTFEKDAYALEQALEEIGALGKYQYLNLSLNEPIGEGEELDYLIKHPYPENPELQPVVIYISYKSIYGERLNVENIILNL